MLDSADRRTVLAALSAAMAFGAASAQAGEIFSPLVRSRLPVSPVVGAFASRLTDEGSIDCAPSWLHDPIIALIGEEAPAGPSPLTDDMRQAVRLATVAAQYLTPRALRAAGYHAMALACETAPNLAAAAGAANLARFDIGRAFRSLRKPRAADLAWGVAAHAGNAAHLVAAARELASENAEAAHDCCVQATWNCYCALTDFLEEGKVAPDVRRWVWGTAVAMIEHALDDPDALDHRT